MITASIAATQVHPALAAAAEGLNNAGVRWLLLRMPEGGLRVPRGDIDLLIHARDCPAAISILETLAFARMPRSGADTHLLTYCAASDQWLWLHVTTAIALGPHQLTVEGADGCLARRELSAAIPRLDPDTEFWTLLWHCLSGKGRVAAHHRPALRTRAAKARTDSESARLFARVSDTPERVSQLLNAVMHDDWTAVEGHAERAMYANAKASVKPVHRRVVRGLARRVASLWRWRERRGLSVAVLGPDGAGKSTLVEGIASSVPFSTRTAYMGLTGGLLRHVRRLRVPGLVFVASACVLWGRYLRAWGQTCRGTLVVFDRYVYDAVAPPGYVPGVFERIGRPLSGYLCPSPDLVLLLDAPGELMHARKGEYDAGTLEQWRRDFLSLRSRLRRLEVIDATQPAAAVRADAVARIWRCYAQRWQSPHANTAGSAS